MCKYPLELTSPLVSVASKPLRTPAEIKTAVKAELKLMIVSAKITRLLETSRRAKDKRIKILFILVSRI